MGQNTAFIDKLLTEAASGYFPEGYISEKIFPFIGVSQYSGKLPKHSHSHLRIETTITGGRGQYRRVEPITRTSSGYEIESHGLEGVITKRDRVNLDQPFDAERDEALGLSSILWTEKERVLAQALANTSTLTQNATLSGTQQFSDKSGSDPISVVQTAKIAIKDGCGRAPNAAWMDYRVAEVLRTHPQLLDLLGFKFAKPGGLSDEDLARALGVQKVLVADADYNSAKEGQTDSLASIWGKNMWLGVCPDSPMVGQVSAGYRLGMKGGSPRKVTKYPVNNPLESTGILVEDEYQFLLSNVGGLYLIKDAIA